KSVTRETGTSSVAETRVGILQYFSCDQPMAQSIGWYGEYLQLQIDLLLRLMRLGDTVLEAGAAIGVHTLAFAEAVGDSGHVLAYAPNSKFRGVLLQNLRANRLG